MTHFEGAAEAGFSLGNAELPFILSNCYIMFQNMDIQNLSATLQQ